MKNFKTTIESRSRKTSENTGIQMLKSDRLHQRKEESAEEGRKNQRKEKKEGNMNKIFLLVIEQVRQFIRSIFDIFVSIISAVKF